MNVIRFKKTKQQIMKCSQRYCQRQRKLTAYPRRCPLTRDTRWCLDGGAFCHIYHGNEAQYQTKSFSCARYMRSLQPSPVPSPPLTRRSEIECHIMKEL